MDHRRIGPFLDPMAAAAAVAAEGRRPWLVLVLFDCLTSWLVVNSNVLSVLFCCTCHMICMMCPLWLRF